VPVPDAEGSDDDDDEDDEDGYNNGAYDRGVSAAAAAAAAAVGATGGALLPLVWLTLDRRVQRLTGSSTWGRHAPYPCQTIPLHCGMGRRPGGHRQDERVVHQDTPRVGSCTLPRGTPQWGLPVSGPGRVNCRPMGRAGPWTVAQVWASRGGADGQVRSQMLPSRGADPTCAEHEVSSAEGSRCAIPLASKG